MTLGREISVQSDDELFARMPERDARDELVRRHGGLAEGLARRFRGRGELDDLTQVALLALVKAIDRFDPERGVPFTAFAAATIVGELKRHLRDTAWAVRVPRRLQEVGLQVDRTITQLTQHLGRAPTVREVSRETGLSEDDVLEGLEVGGAFEAESLDASRPDGTGAARREPGSIDENMELLEEWETVAEAIRALPERERTILYLRFFRGMSQSQIASEIGISQMHVSRILARRLAELRREVGPQR
jgi:RNA polymerase sigma-B factor